MMMSAPAARAPVAEADLLFRQNVRDPLLEFGLLSLAPERHVPAEMQRLRGPARVQPARIPPLRLQDQGELAQR
jgi:hypothetical protein